MAVASDRNSPMLELPQPAMAVPIDLELLKPLCKSVRFEHGDVLRRNGQHYTDMYVVTDGWVDVELASRNVTLGSRTRGAGSPIGEIGFLRGWPATATVTARTAVGALVIDDPTLARLENEQPLLAAQLLRHLAKVAEERTSDSLTFISIPAAYAKAPAIEVYLCRTSDMLERAQRLRYDVYCRELGRSSPYADHDRKIISDDLDDTGHTFIAVEAGEAIGTLRGNAASEGSLGVLEELYGMNTSSFHPAATAICTKFIVKKSKRGSPTSMSLMAAMMRYAIRHDMKECYIDCIPALLPYYKAVGFKITAPKFFHRENGPSHPMKLDVGKHGDRLSHDYAKSRLLALYMKAKFIRWIDTLRGEKSLVGPR
jgi:CRP-like cAMP-binding protein